MIGPRQGAADAQVWIATAPVDMRKSFDGLAEVVRTFLGHDPLSGQTEGFLNIDNNAAERALKRVAIGRKNWLFLGNDRGGRTAAILLSFMASCKANQVEPWAYVRDMISKLSEQPRGESPPSARLAELLPDAWLAAHPEAHRPWSR